MKRSLAVLLLSSMMSQGPAQAADQWHDVDVRQVVLTDRGSHEQRSHPSFNFRMDVVGDQDGLKTEQHEEGRSWVTAHPGEAYSIRLYNPLPVRVAVTVTVDGLNTLTGQPSGIADGSKWMMEPYGQMTLRGWQVSGSDARRFFFTDKPHSYVAWQGKRLKKSLAQNAGVMGAAFFWNQSELDDYYASQPIDQRTRAVDETSAASPVSAMSSTFGGALQDAQRAPKGAEPRREAATGMGEHESHPVTDVAFDYNRGMYRQDEAIVIFYRFEAPPVTPNPFPSIDYAPEMPLPR